MFHCATSATAVTYSHKMFIKKVPDGISFSNFENISAEKYQNIQINLSTNTSSGQSYKTFYGRNLWIFVISQSACP